MNKTELELFDLIGRLSEEKQTELLQYARALAGQGTPGRELVQWLEENPQYRLPDPDEFMRIIDEAFGYQEPDMVNDGANSP